MRSRATPEPASSVILSLTQLKGDEAEQNEDLEEKEEKERDIKFAMRKDRCSGSKSILTETFMVDSSCAQLV